MAIETTAFDHPTVNWRTWSGQPFLFEFWKSFTVSESRVFHEAHCEDFVILACIVLIESQSVTGRQTDGHGRLCHS